MILDGFTTELNWSTTGKQWMQKIRKTLLECWNSIWHYRLFNETPCCFCVMSHWFLYLRDIVQSYMPDVSLAVKSAVCYSKDFLILRRFTAKKVTKKLPFSDDNYYQKKENLFKSLLWICETSFVLSHKSLEDTSSDWMRSHADISRYFYTLRAN